MRSARDGILPLVLSLFVARPATTQLDTQLVAGGFTNPHSVTAAPGVANTLYVVERGGRIR